MAGWVGPLAEARVVGEAGSTAAGEMVAVAVAERQGGEGMAVDMTEEAVTAVAALAAVSPGGAKAAVRAVAVAVGAIA